MWSLHFLCYFFLLCLILICLINNNNNDSNNSGQSNVTTGCIATTHGRFSGSSVHPTYTCFLGPIRITISDEVSIGSAIFAQFTAERPYTLAVWLPFPPQNCRFSWGRSGPLSNAWLLGPIQAHNPKSIVINWAVFAQLTTEWPSTLQWVAPFPLEISASYGGSGPPFNTWFLWLTHVLNPDGILIGSGVFAGSH